MTLSNTGILSAVELPIYLIIVPFVMYLTYRHGEAGFLGYFYLNISCGVRIAADIVELAQGTQVDNSTAKPTIAAIVIGSIGLSPLLLALAGMAHDLPPPVPLATKTAAKAKSVRRWMVVAQVQIHAVIIVGMVLLIIG